MKIMRKMIATILAIICSVSCISCMNAFASDTDEYSKFDSELKLKVESMDEYEKIPVSIWLNENENEISKLVQQKLIEKFSNEDSKLINIAMNNKNAIKDISMLSNQIQNDEESINQSNLMQKIIESKRNMQSKVVLFNNKTFMKSLEKKIIKEDFNENSDIIYVSKYMPNIELYLTKKNLEIISKFSEIDKIYYKRDYIEELIENNDVSTYSIKDDFDNPNFGNFFNPTGLSVNRDAFGLNGGNVKIGICDKYFGTRNSMKAYFTNSPFGGYESDSIFSNIAAPRHGDMVADILAGQYKDSDGKIVYKGIVPNSKLYLANAEESNTLKYKTSLEYLVSQGCSVINMSRSIGDDGNNTYGDAAKWIDEFVQRYNVNIVISAGNDVTGVTSGKMAYNAIVVGSCDENGKIANNSCYSNSNNKAYKPDITAFGVDVNIPTNPNGVSGTSCAAPMVTGLVAQLCQLNATLRANPTLMKAVVVNSTRRKDVLLSDTYLSVVGKASYPINHKYGVGVMYAPDAYIMVHDDNYFSLGQLDSNTNTVELEQKISARKDNKLVRIVLNVSNNYPSLSLETLKLQVTDPNGNVYTSQYKYDTKQVVAIKPGTSGIYKIKLSRLNGTNYNLDYALSYNVIME